MMNHPKRLLTAFGVGVLCVGLTVFADTVHVEDDAAVYNAAPATPLGALPDLYVANAGGALLRSFVRLDLETLPKECEIKESHLRLFVSAISGQGRINVHLVQEPWTEGGITWNNQPPFDPAIVDSIPVSTADTQEYITANLRTLVNKWVDGSLQNNGVVLIPTDGLVVVLNAKENVEASHDPEGEIAIVKPTDPGTTTSWTDGPGKVTTTVDVGIGISDPSSELEVAGTIETNSIMGRSTITSIKVPADLEITMEPVNNPGIFSFFDVFHTSGAPIFSLSESGNLNIQGTLTEGSSRELKENINTISSAQAAKVLEGLKAVSFNYKGEDDKDLHLGFIAEEVPDLVATNNRKGISPMDIVAVLAKALQDQQARIDAMEKQLQLRGLAEINP